MTAAPDPIVALAEARALAKAARDFAEADRLRAEIDAAGWRITDTPSGFALEPKPAYVASESLSQVEFEPADAEVSVGVIIEGWWEDALTCISSLIEYSDALVYVLDVSGEDETALAIERLRSEHSIRLRTAHLIENPGWGPAARTLAELSRSEFHVLIDPSSVLTGPAFAMLKAAFDAPDVVAAGWRGALVDVDDEWRSVIDAGPGEVDVLLGYLMMVRRAALLATDYPHPRARFYRNADLELSLGLRAAGGKLVAMELPVEQGRHHGYHDSDPQVRERESKRNYDRILTEFRGRNALLSARNPHARLG